MKLEAVTKLDKRNKKTSKKFDDDVISENVTSLSFFRLLVDLEQSRGRIPNTESTKFMFSVIVTLTKKSLTQLSHYCFE